MIEQQLLILDYYEKALDNYQKSSPEKTLSKKTLLKVINQLVEFQNNQLQIDGLLNASLKVHKKKFVGKIEVEKQQAQIFHLSKHLGSGEFGDVYEALDINTGMISAYKTSKQGDKVGARSIENEYKILEVLNSHGKVWGIQNKPHTIHDVMHKSQRNTGYLGEKFDGDLLDTINSLETIDVFEGLRLINDLSNPQTLENNLFIAHQLLTALEFMQSKGILHGDIKLQNILARQEPNGTIACLADWGHAKRVNQPLETLTKEMVYTRSYFYRITGPEAEEILKTKSKFIEIQQKRDMFAMGTTLYQLFSGLGPYPLSKNGYPITKNGYTPILHLPKEINQLLQSMLEFDKMSVSMVSQAFQTLQTYIETTHPLLAQKIHVEMSKNPGTVYELTKLPIADQDKSPEISEQLSYFRQNNHFFDEVENALAYLSQPTVLPSHFVIWPDFDEKNSYVFLQKSKDGFVNLEDARRLIPQEYEESLFDLVEEQRRLFF